MTINDIAQICNVTKATVSRAFNNYDCISSKTKTHILKVAKRMNYQPNIYAAALKTKQLKTIGLIVYDITNPFFSELLQSMEEEINKKRYNLILCITENKPEKENEYIHLLQQHKVDGMIIVPSHRNSKKTIKYLKQLKKSKIPFSVVGNINAEKSKSDYITVDDIKSGEILTKHLVASGYKKILYIFTKKTIREERIGGIKKIIDRKNLILSSFNKFKLDVKSPFYNRKLDRTAIIAETDFLAIKIWQELNSHNIKVPKDIGLAGFDNIKLVTELGFSLTTIDNSCKEMAKNIVKLLLNRIEHPDIRQQKFIFEPKLIIRDSTNRRLN